MSVECLIVKVAVVEIAADPENDAHFADDQEHTRTAKTRAEWRHLARPLVKVRLSNQLKEHNEGIFEIRVIGVGFPDPVRVVHCGDEHSSLERLQKVLRFVVHYDHTAQVYLMSKFTLPQGTQVLSDLALCAILILLVEGFERVLQVLVI